MSFYRVAHGIGDPSRPLLNFTRASPSTLEPAVSKTSFYLSSTCVPKLRTALRNPQRWLAIVTVLPWYCGIIEFQLCYASCQRRKHRIFELRLLHVSADFLLDPTAITPTEDRNRREPITFHQPLRA